MPIEQLAGWVSPRLAISFVPGEGELGLFHPNGQPFLSFVELQRQVSQAEAAREQAEHARGRGCGVVVVCHPV